LGYEKIGNKHAEMEDFSQTKQDLACKYALCGFRVYFSITKQTNKQTNNNKKRQGEKKS